MGTGRWTTSTFVGCCIWILHGLRAAGAIPVTTEGSFATGTVSPIATESEGPHALVMGTAETSTTVANAEIAESILAGSPSSLSFPAGAQTDALVAATSAYGSTALTLINVTKPLNTSQDNKGGSAAPTAATSTAAIPEQHPAVTPEAALDVTGAVPTAPLGTTPLFAGVKEDVPAAVTREEAENLDPTVGDVLFPTLPAVTWGAQPAADSPVGAGVTVLPSQGVTTGTGAVKEGTTQLVGIQTEDSANSWSPSAGSLITNQQDGMLSRDGGIAPEPEGETAPAAEESPSALVPGARGDAVNGEFSTAGSSLLSPESATVGSPGEPSILPSQAALSPATSLAPAGNGDRDGQGAPGLSSEGSTLSPAAIEAPAAPEVTEDMATSLLAPRVPTDAQSDTNPPVLDTALPTEDVGTMGLAKPSLQPAPWQIPIGEQPPLLASALPPPTDNSSALRASYPPSGAGASTLPAAGDGAETGTSPGLAAASGTPVSPSLRGSQPWGITAGAPQGANGPGTDSSSDVPSPASFIPDGLAWPAAGVQGQGAEGPGDIAQAGGPGDDSLYADIQSDTSRSAFSTQQDAANTGELPAGETEALANAKLSPPSALGDRAGAAPAQGQVPPPGPASLSSAGLQPDLSGAEGPGDLPSEFPSAPGAAYPPLGSAAGPVSGAETPVSPDLSAAQGAPVSPSFEEPQPWGTAAGAPQGAGLPGASGPGTVLTSAWDVPSSAVYGPAGPPSPALGDQFGTNPGLPAVEGHGTSTTEPVLGGAGSGTEFEPSLISAAGDGTVVGVNQLPGAGSLSGPASPTDVVATSSISEDNGAGLIPAAAPVPDSLSPASPDSETGPGLARVLGADGTGNAVQAGNPESGRPYTETSPSAFSAQQDPSNTRELPAGETGALVNAELSPPSAPEDRTETGAAPALGQVSPPGPASLGSAGLQPNLSGAEGPGDLPSEFPSAPGAAYPPLGSAAGLVSGAETPVSPDLSAAQGAPVSPSFEEPQPWGTAAGAPQGAGLPGASGPGTVLTSAWDVPSSAVYGPAGPPSPALGDQFGTNPGLPAVEGQGPGTTEPVLGGAGSGTEFEPSLISAAGDGTAAGVNQLPGAGSLSSPASPTDVVATSSISEDNGAGLIPAAAPVPDSLSPASPDSETGPGLARVLGADGTGNAVQAGNPESGRPYTETSPSAFSAQQDPSNTRELPAGETGALVNAELSPPSAPEDRTGTGAAPALGQVSPPGPASLGSAGLQPNLSGAEGPGDLPSEFPNAPGAAYPPLGSAAGPVSEAETPVSPDLSAAQGAPVSPSFEEPQPWGTAAGAPQGAGLPGASGPGTVLTSAWDVPSSAVYGPAGPPSPALGDQFGTNPGLPAVEGHGTSTTELVLGGAGSGTESEPSLISAAGGGTAAGVNQLPGAGSLSGPASLSDVVATSSLLDTASPSALGGAGSTPGALQSSLGAGPGVPPAAGEGAGEAAGDGTSLGQTAAEGQPAGSGAPDGEAAAVLQQSASTSSSTVGSSSPGTAANGANLPGAGEASNGLSTGLEAAGPEEPPVSAPGIQSGADLGLSDAKLSQVNVVDLPRGALANRGPSSNASLGEGAGPIIQTTSGVSAPSALASPQETQPLLPVAPGAGGVSDGTATPLPASLLLPGHGLTSGPAPNGDPHFVPSTQSGSAPLALGAPGGLAGDAGGAQLWSPEDEVASGVPAPSGEASPRAPTSPNAAPVLPSALEGESSAEGVSAGPGLSARESLVGSSAGGKGELGTAVLGGPALLLPPRQPGSPGDPSGDADGLVPGEANDVLPKVMAGRGDVAQLLPSVTGARAAMETPPRSSLGGTPGLSVLPLAGIAAGSPGSKIPRPGPVSGLSPAGMQPLSGNKVTTSLANGVLAASGSSLHAAFPGQGGTPRGFPATARPVVSCSPVTTSPAPPAPIPGVRKVLPSPAAATVTSHASSPVSPAPPGGPVTALNLLPSPTAVPQHDAPTGLEQEDTVTTKATTAVPAIPLYGYGARENDREYVERKVDFNSPLFKPETGFPFGNTLRSSLYFTDNGQIIFPASDNSIFTYPNPPPRGFSGREEVPMIAVFWDNADFSRGVGTTFYQEFPTLNTDKPPFVRDVEAKVRRYLRSSYSAAWTLKITWEKAPAYGARTDTRRTITYQAVLTTDGFRSYVLMLYQAGGMQWDYTRLPATNVLIGYTSGDGFYRNDDLTRRPPAAKYRPDQFRGYNTDLRGLWIYKLESRVGINYRLKCLAWTGQQQEPRMWSQGLPACPCTLQQGQRDPRFKSSRRGWGAPRVSMLHSASPNPYGAGVRCLYDSQSRLIEGRQERYWRFFRQASPFRDQELKLYDWCCNQAGSAHLCARYSEKRPKIGCDGYQSPGTGSSEEEESSSKEQGDREDK